MAEKIARLLEREGTGISWADLTFNPWIGCQKVSPACDHCYAEDLATARLGVAWGPGAARRRTAPGNWQKPLRWQKLAAEAGIRLKVFCASLADIMDNAVDDQWRADLGRLIIATPALDWMILTKRIGNAEAMLAAMFPEGVPPNVALGVSIPNQQEADRDIPRAIEVKARLSIRRLFLSMEPLLGPVDLTEWLLCPNARDGLSMDPSTGAYECCRACDWTGLIGDIDLVIVGGESGADARFLRPEWAQSLRDQCASAGVPFHFKQWGEWLPGGQGNPRGVDLNRYPPLIEGEGANAVITAYRVGVRNAAHYLDRIEHREHFHD